MEKVVISLSYLSRFCTTHPQLSKIGAHVKPELDPRAMRRLYEFTVGAETAALEYRRAPGMSHNQGEM